MVKDVKEKKRVLTEAEKRRLAHYEKLSEEYEARGFRRTELTVGIVRANIFAILYGIPLSILGFVLFFMKNNDVNLMRMSFSKLILLMVLMVILVVVHELVHGITWSFFTENHWKDIEFGFMKEYLTPYCTCACPLTRGQYIIGTLMPLVLLGLIPLAAAIMAGSYLWLWLGIIMTMSAGGDILIVINILKYKSQAAQVVYIDHPTQAGGVIFEK
ncbi:MAG: DUF3267 domain-containing protein [Lachnospiraceae bacterium]|nr:DUF3267 domain-containing protein [Lachnospiraceae bacterium]